MGEVKVRVKLTNLFDRAAAREGRLSADKVRSIEVDALVDTGAVLSVLPASVARSLGLQATDKQVAEYADGRKEQVDLVEGLRFEIMNRHCADEALILGNEVLIGQTVLEKMDLLVDWQRRQLVPNPDHPNAPVIKIK